MTDRDTVVGSPPWNVVLKALREARGVTQDGWAAWLGVSRATIQRWESGDAVPGAAAEATILAVLRERGLLRAYAHGPLGGLEVTPAFVGELLAEARSGAARGTVRPASRADVMATASRSGVALAGATPATSFIGRESEARTVARLLGASRLLTLTGAGGVGKTRLATHVAGAVADRYADGVRLVELAAISDPALVPHAVARALDLREQPGRTLLEGIADALGDKHILLLLDNCEHLRDAAASLADAVLRVCRGVRILATSREPLDVIDETVWWVPSMSVGAFGERGAAFGIEERARESAEPPTSNPEPPDAVRLFCARATTAHAAFALTDANAPAVAAICRRLDGIPLAIELAAARIRVLTPEQIADRLDARLRLLTRGNETALPRHQTLRAALDWSYDLLTDPERRLLARLAVFPAGCDLETAEAVCGDDLVDLLHDLVEKSLLVVEHRGDAARYRLLETVREYGQERLEASGEMESVRRRLATWALALAERAAPHLAGADQEDWLSRLEMEHDTLRAVLRWAIGEDARAGLTLTTALGRFWLVRGHLTEARAWLARLLDRGASAPPGLRAGAIHFAAQLATRQGDYDDARAGADAALALYGDLGDDHGVARSLAMLGHLAYYRADFAAAKGFAGECLAIARRIDDRALTLMALSDLANAVQFEGDLDAARAYYEEAVAICRELGDLGNVSILLGNAALLAIRREDYARARPVVEEAIAIQRRLGGRSYIAAMLSWLATIAREGGDAVAARRHLAEALEIARAIGDIDNATGVEEQLADLDRRDGDLAGARAHAAEAARLAATLDDGKRHVTALLTAARVASDLGRHRAAARLFGAAQAQQDRIGYVPFPRLARETDAFHEITRDALGEDTFRAVWTDGLALLPGEALDFVLADALAAPA